MMELLQEEAPLATDCGHEDLIDWYYTTFVIAPAQGYDYMTPSHYTHKYARTREPLSRRRIAEALAASALGQQCPGRPSKNGSLAVRLEHPDGGARIAAVDIDAGGRAAVQCILDACVTHGLWAFAELSVSDTHTGGHVYIPVEAALPASLLRDLARRILAGAGVAGEAYPNKAQSLRAPGMLHQRAPGGPRRFPLVLSTGRIIDSGDLWADLVALRSSWQANTPQQMTATLDQLPPLAPDHPPPLHTSQVCPKRSTSVITWFNREQSLDDMLRTAGATGHGAVRTCPWHDDQHPSLVIWQHYDGHTVCRCMSQQASCPAAAVPYWDAFNLYQEAHGMSADQAVQDIVDQYGLGTQKTLRLTPSTYTAPTTVTRQAHQDRVAYQRVQLQRELEAAVCRPGEVTVIRAVPGLGKTRAGAKLANELFASGKRVAIVVSSHAIAKDEWYPLLEKPFIWLSRIELCSCQEQAKLKRLPELGYAQPRCVPTCPYYRQDEAIGGHIAIFQYNHLFLNDGKLLQAYDVVIIDESPLAAFVSERSVSRQQVCELRDYVVNACDQAMAFVLTLLRVTENEADLDGGQLVHAMKHTYRGNFTQLLADAQNSAVSEIHPAPNQATPLDRLPLLFLGELLRALAHDCSLPNSLLHYHNAEFSWIDPKKLLRCVVGTISAPAVLVLDGSASKLLCTQLYKPWPVTMVDLDVSMAPDVHIIQCVVGASTRGIVKTEHDTERVIAKVAVICNERQLLLDGGITYKAAVAATEKQFGGVWLYYGNQRGKNDLVNATAIAILGSPTMKWQAVQRQALALWSDDPVPLDLTTEKESVGYYPAADPRFQALVHLHGPEELRQAIHRIRPILRTSPISILVCSPWDLTALGFVVHTEVTELPHGNGKVCKTAREHYQQRRAG
jgi:hypothetical protein